MNETGSSDASTRSFSRTSERDTTEYSSEFERWWQGSTQTSYTPGQEEKGAPGHEAQVLAAPAQGPNQHNSAVERLLTHANLFIMGLEESCFSATGDFKLAELDPAAAGGCWAGELADSAPTPVYVVDVATLRGERRMAFDRVLGMREHIKCGMFPTTMPQLGAASRRRGRLAIDLSMLFVMLKATNENGMSLESAVSMFVDCWHLGFSLQERDLKRSEAACARWRNGMDVNITALRVLLWSARAWMDESAEALAVPDGRVKVPCWACEGPETAESKVVPTMRAPC